LYNDYFCKQADLNDPETSVPDIIDILINGLEQITITEKRVKKTNNAMVKKTNSAMVKKTNNSMVKKTNHTMVKRQTMQLSKIQTIQWS
jgi:hypothetical protein